MEPERAVVRVEVGQVEFPATFIVRPDVLGLPADGYRVTAVQVDPPTVVVTGPADAASGQTAFRVTGWAGSRNAVAACSVEVLGAEATAASAEIKV
ncbi:MAG: hypothetical protein IIC53_08685 [Proteobacteria bacterium]|nr:hypothetical protein [Pseudomonadota bacterium]